VVQSPESENQQEEKNVVDERKNIMDNRNASTEQSISNNYKEGEMHGSDQDTKSIKERLLGAIESINVNQVKGLVEKDTNVTESILSEALKKANERIANLKAGNKKQDQENRLTQMIELLETKLKNISAAIGSQVTPAAEPKESEEDQPDSPQSSVSDDERSSSSSSFVNVPTSGKSGTDTSNGEHSQTLDSNNDTSSFEKIDEESVATTTDSEDSSSECSEVSSIEDPTDDEALLLDKENSTLEGDSSLQQDTQPKTLVPGGKPGSVVTENGQDPHPTPNPPAPTPEPEPAPTPIPLVASKKPEQVSNAAPQNTKSSNLHIAASALAAVGVILGVAIAVHLEMLVVGILVGVCCLVAAAVMYHYEWPSSFIENNKVEKVVPNEKKEPVDTSV